MKKHLQDAISSPSFKASKLKRQMLLAALAAGSFFATPALAQLNYQASTATNTTTTYTDLGTTGTAITVANNDNANSAVVPIGFTFNYNGLAFTDFILNTNGFIKLGNTPPSAATLLNAIGSNLAADVNIIAASSYVDLQGAANQTTNPTEFRVATTGTAPNRVTTIQFKNLSDKPTATFATASQFATMDFQIRLFETTNVIELVYGTWTASANTSDEQPLVIGLKGSSNAVTNRLLAVKANGTDAWSTTFFAASQGTSTGLLPHFVEKAMLPTAGRTYRFTPTVIPPNDLSVEDIFTQGKISVASGTPHQVKAVIKNTGTATATNKTITLDVSGANTVTSTATIATLAPGASTEVTFPAYTPTTTGENVIEVSVPADDNAGNDNKDALQVVSANGESFAQYPDQNSDPALTTASPAPFGQTPDVNSGARLSRFFATNKVRINSIRTYIPSSVGFTQPLNTLGRTIKALVVDASGNVLAESADIVLTASNVDQFIDIPFTTPAVVENQAYFTGIHLAPLATATNFAYAFSAQTQAVNRTGAMFIMPTPGATPTAPVSNPSVLRLLVEANITNITGVKEDLNAKLVSVYPNPSNGVFNVSAKDMKGSNLNIEVRDMQGRLVYSAAAAKDNATINLKNVASGVYMLKASTDAEVAVKRIVVK